jgi:hypothetical protein
MQNTLPWAEEARCRGLSTAGSDPWHPGGRPATRAVAYAVGRRVCAGCPVRLECAQYGLSLLELAGNQGGMFGGLTPRELMKLARELELPRTIKAQHGSRAGYVAGCRCAPCRAENTRYEHTRRSPFRAVSCSALTDGGGGCHQPARPGSALCAQHEGQAVELAS